MKCIKPTETGVKKGLPADRILRVENDQAHRYVKRGLATYCPKSEWKAAGRH